MRLTKSRKLVFTALVSVLLLSLSACSKGGKPEKTTNQDKMKSNNLTSELSAESVQGNEPDEQFTKASADFAVELLKQSTFEDVNLGKNVLISPESVMQALAMTANGAAENTLAEMEQVICGGMDINELNKYMYTYSERLTASKDIEFNIANSIWIKDVDYIKVKDEFLQTDKNYYNSDAFLSDFDGEAVNDINGWVSENTNGMINKLLEEISPNTYLYLINTIAFEGEWEDVYEEHQITEEEKFTNSNGGLESVTMLNSTEGLFISDDNSKGFIKYYKGGDYAFMAILPDEGVSIDEYINGMTGDSFINLYNGKVQKDVIVMLPEFTYEYSISMKEPLIQMGMPSAFDENADFSNMADSENTNLYIGDVQHKTFIQVDRIGTKAAAVTAVSVDGNEAFVVEEPEQVYLDRPFIYTIVDTDTGIPIFIGVVNTVEG